MSDCLDVWIGETVEQELGQWLLWRENDTNGPLSRGRVGDTTFEDDGSYLKCKSLKPRIVQIVKFEKFDEPHKAFVSDGITRIKVKISSDASQRYSAKHKRSVTHGTPGGLIQLLDFEIVATHLGPRQERVIIEVNDFQSIGSNGSGFFGNQAPVAIESRSEVKEILKKLEVLRNKAIRADHLSPNPSIRSQFSTGSSVDEPDSASQALFATQAPFYHAPTAPGSNPPTSGKEFAVGLSTGRASPRDTGLFSGPSIPNNTNSVMPLPGFEPVQATRVPEMSTVNGKNGLAHNSAALLGLVGQAPKLRKIEAAAPVSIKPLAAKYHSEDGLATAQEGKKSENPRKPLGSSTGGYAQKPLTQEAAANSRKPPANQGLVPPVATREQIQVPARKHISSRDVRIPKDQEALLDIANSWLPAEPGHREPVANVPISILKSMNRDADKRALRATATNPRKRKRGVKEKSEDQSVRNGTMHDSESDVPISSGQWPPSPDRDQLPPDSSMASADQSDHSKTESVAPATLGTFTAQSANPSPASSPMKSRVVATTNSMEMSSSSNFQSASEDAVLTECPVSGRGKSYEDAVTLKTHTDGYHSDMALGERLSCIEECNRSFASLSGHKTHSENNHNGKGSARHGVENHGLEAPASRISTPTTSNTISTSPLNAIVHVDGGNRSVKGLENGSCNDALVSAHMGSQSSESDLETKAPHPLNEKEDLNNNTAPMQRFPSTASQPELPFTQVQRTPYPNSRKSSDQHPLPSKSKYHDILGGSPPDSTSHVTLSLPDAASADIRLGKADGENTNAQVPERNETTIKSTALTNTTEAGARNQALDHEVQIVPEAQIPRPDSADQLSQGPGTNVMDPSYHRTETELLDSPHESSQTKRKVGDASFLSPNVSKRRRFEFPATFGSDEKLKSRRDPSEGARQIRKEFLASRKNSETGTPMQSPTTHLATRLNENYPPVQNSVAEPEPTHIKTDGLNQSDAGTGQAQQTVTGPEASLIDIGKSPSPAIDSDCMKPAADDIETVTLPTERPMQKVQSADTALEIQLLAPQHDDTLSAPKDDDARPGAKDRQIEDIERDPNQQPLHRGVMVREPLDRCGSSENSAMEKEAPPAPATTKPFTTGEEAQLASANIFAKFKATYPRYTGDIKHFVAMCNKISSLSKANRMEHQSLWDDFIIRQKVEYAQYVIRCTEDGEDTIPYEEYYRTEILEPQFRDLVLTRRNLEEALLLLPRAGKGTTKQVDTIHKEKSHDNSETLPQVESSTASTKSGVSSGRRPVAIDLTEDSGRGHYTNSTEVALNGPPKNKQTPSRRFLPWSEHSSPPNSDGSQPSPGSSPHARFKEFMNTPRASRSLMYKPTAKTAGDRHDRPDSHGALIRSVWGVRPNDVLKTQYLDILTQRQLSLMKDIAQNVDLAEGRRLIEKQIRSRTERMDGIATPKVTDADLEAVRDAVLEKKQASAEVRTKRSRVDEDSSMTTSDPLSMSQANASEVLRDPGGSGEWWRDDSSPFKTFARAYASIRQGHGNSFAKPAGTDEGPSGVGGQGRGAYRARLKLKRIDILKWDL